MDARLAGRRPGLVDGGVGRVGRHLGSGIEPAADPDDIARLEATARDPGRPSLCGREHVPSQRVGQRTEAAWHDWRLPRRGGRCVRPPHLSGGRCGSPGQEGGPFLPSPSPSGVPHSSPSSGTTSVTVAADRSPRGRGARRWCASVESSRRYLSVQRPLSMPSYVSTGFWGRSSPPRPVRAGLSRPGRRRSVSCPPPPAAPRPARPAAPPRPGRCCAGHVREPS